jgi:hypothetical protein
MLLHRLVRLLLLQFRWKIYRSYTSKPCAILCQRHDTVRRRPAWAVTVHGTNISHRPCGEN